LNKKRQKSFTADVMKAFEQCFLIKPHSFNGERIYLRSWKQWSLCTILYWKLCAYLDCILTADTFTCPHSTGYLLFVTLICSIHLHTHTHCLLICLQKS